MNTLAVDWFARGYSVMRDQERDPSHYPPLNDIEAQRQWLGGFGAGWAELPLEYQNDQATITNALDIALDGQQHLFQQLLSHGFGKQTRH